MRCKLENAGEAAQVALLATIPAGAREFGRTSCRHTGLLHSRSGHHRIADAKI